MGPVLGVEKNFWGSFQTVSQAGVSGTDDVEWRLVVLRELSRGNNRLLSSAGMICLIVIAFSSTAILSTNRRLRDGGIWGARRGLSSVSWIFIRHKNWL
jgi:hypothetical protein